MNIQQIFNFFQTFFPDENLDVKAVSIYPLPYPGHFEIYLELNNGKRYRALANRKDIISGFVEFDLGVKNGTK